MDRLSRRARPFSLASVIRVRSRLRPNGTSTAGRARTRASTFFALSPRKAGAWMRKGLGSRAEGTRPSSSLSLPRRAKPRCSQARRVEGLISLAGFGSGAGANAVARPGSRQASRGRSSRRGFIGRVSVRVEWACACRPTPPGRPTAPALRASSVRPGELALDLLAVERAALDGAVGAILDAQEVQRRVVGVAPGPRTRRADPHGRAFGHVDALAVNEELALAGDDEVDLVVVP